MVCYNRPVVKMCHKQLPRKAHKESFTTQPLFCMGTFGGGCDIAQLGSAKAVDNDSQNSEKEEISSRHLLCDDAQC